jgi:hypothetical protein
MIQLEIDADEIEVLREVIESARSDLGYEIANTDNYDYRDQLKKKKDLLKRVLDQLSAT